VRDASVSTVVFDLPSTGDGPAPECTVTTRAYREGMALELSWRSERWTQQVIISLDHTAARPEATIARNTVASNGDALVELTNLGSTPRSWNLGGRDLSVDPGGVLRVRESPTNE
jgi:hypothetical protein